MVRFTGWFNLVDEEIEAEAPPGPAALQVRRAAGLVDYPTGKSAMVWYGFADASAQALLRDAFQKQLRDEGDPHHGALQFRFIAGTTEAQETLATLQRRFHRRFGSSPILNRPPPETH